MPEAPAARKFGTFTGVFTPTLLTILGVIMYIRLPWVVGNAGLLGAFAIMGIALGITVCTGLSLSSISSNTRVGDGGPYAMINRSLGLEVGGSIGIPLYLSRPLGIAMYVFGFREGWLWIFPTHDPLLVDMIVYAAIFGLAFLSANLAFRVQYLIMALIGLSLVCILGSGLTFAPRGELQLFGTYPGFPEDGFGGTDFWTVFAVFFPATTGILAGANMSGDLANPRKSISQGTLWAIGISTVTYFALAVWCSWAGTVEELRSNYNFMMDVALWGPGVLAGLLGATFSSALAGAVGGPRILMAMGENRILPGSKWLKKRSRGGEPRIAVAITAILTFGCLMMRDLNAIAPLVTMFFLITYLMINVVLLIESSLGLMSFRPTLRVHRSVPFVGALGCVFTMFIVNPTFGLVAVGMSVAIFLWLQKRKLGGAREDVRSSMFVAAAEWAAARVAELGGRNVRAWKPNLLVPVEDPTELRGEFGFLLDVCKPEGTMKLLGVATERTVDEMEGPLLRLITSFQAEGLFVTHAMLTSDDYESGVVNGLQALRGAFFRPNILFMALPEETDRLEETGEIIVRARETGVGILFLGMHPRAGLGQRKTVNMYVRPSHAGWDVASAFDYNNLDLTLLMGHRLHVAWGGALNIITVISDEAERADADAFLEELRDLARLPDSAASLVLVGDFETAVANAPQSDIDVMGMQSRPDFEFMNRMIDVTQSSVLFVADSGRESARA